MKENKLDTTSKGLINQTLFMGNSNKPSSLFTSLKTIFTKEKHFNSAIIIAESILAIATGTFFSEARANSSLGMWALTIGSLTLIVLLMLRRLRRDTDFPITALGELQATIELADQSRYLERKRAIDSYIDYAVQALNTNTCVYSGEDAEIKLCDSSITAGLKSVYHPFLENTANLLNSFRGRYTVGASFSKVNKLPANFEMGKKIYNLSEFKSPETIVLRDNFALSELFTPDILNNESLHNEQFHIQTQFRDTLRHSGFLAKQIELRSITYLLITSPIPVVCESEENQGVFFILCEPADCPSDLADVMLIFNRLFANWLSKYEDCVFARIENSNEEYFKKIKSSVAVPAEVQKLMAQQASSAQKSDEMHSIDKTNNNHPLV